jgi:hypothetical protein
VTQHACVPAGKLLHFALARTQPESGIRNGAASARSRRSENLTAWTHEHVSTREFQVLREAVANLQPITHEVELVSSLCRNHERWVFTAALNGTLLP